ncbi:MAG: polysaccharide export protein [Acidobacteriota bacterium]|nr:polysaccharide export protein [Acidobacteriota bacterium]
MKDVKDLLDFSGHLRVAGMTCLCVLTALLTVLEVATAQQPSANAEAPSKLSVKTVPGEASLLAQTDKGYRIGPDDVLDIRVYNRPQLSRDAVRVDARGMIRMPMIEDEIQAACRSESELSKEIAARYLKYQRKPYVDVFVKEYQSQPVAVIGAVDKPGRFQLQRRVRLLELLSFAGGPTERAGGRIQITRAPTALRCESPVADAADERLVDTLVAYNLRDTLRGDGEANPYVQPGDIVSLPDAEQAFVVGNVLRPSAIPLREPITVSRAIAMAGGLMPDTKSSKIRIIRQLAGSKSEVLVDLMAIEKRQAEDVTLLAGDIVDVPMSGGKRFLRGLVGTIAPTISNLPVQVVR